MKRLISAGPGQWEVLTPPQKPAPGERPSPPTREPATQADSATADKILEENLPEGATLISCCVFLPKGNGIINCRVGTAHQQIRF
jgi:hypothetical protein